jgi:hypothetical protein
MTLQTRLRIDYDRDYGIDRQTGWSVAINGVYLVQYERCLLVALSKAYLRHWSISE